MRGHVHRRGETWTYVVDAGMCENGKRKQRTKGGFRTKREAQAALNNAISALHQGTYIEPVKLTVGHYLTDQWLPAIRATVRPSTFASYKMHVRKYLVPRLGQTSLQKLTAPMVNALYAEMQQPADDRQALKPATVQRVHATLHKSLRDAVRWQFVSRNVAADADPPRAPRPKTRVWTPQQLHRFLDLAADSPLYTLWLFYAFTGVRRGEALGLRWDDLDLSTGRAAITQAVVPVDHALVFSEPKTDKGRRAVDLDDMTVAALKKHRRQQLENRMAMGSAYVDHDLVFARIDGSPIHPEYVSRTFSKLVKKLGLPAIRLHDLRHTHASIALIAGVATRVVSDRLGHSATAVTSDLYQHVISDLGADAATRVADVVRRAGEVNDAHPTEASRS